MTRDESQTRVHRINCITELDVSASGVDPIIVQISDIHGYLTSAQSALLAVGDVDEFDPIVELDASNTLHWAGGEQYVLVFNGDVIDRGSENAACLDLVWRLQREAPPGHVRYLLGNHEMALLLPEVLSWPMWYSGKRSESDRRAFYRAILEGRITVGFDGYDYTYSHAGSPDDLDVSDLNTKLRTAAGELLGATDSDRSRIHHEIVDRFPTIFGMGGPTGRGPGAGVLWLDYAHMPDDAPPQVVGHTKQLNPTRSGDVICGNVIRKNEGSIGGEGVIVETPDRIGVVVRKEDRSASSTYFSL